ncbi:hypothetical protein D3C81_2167830 [compost metagenome]
MGITGIRHTDCTFRDDFDLLPQGRLQFQSFPKKRFIPMIAAVNIGMVKSCDSSFNTPFDKLNRLSGT